MTGTVSAFYTISQWHTVFLYPYSMSYLSSGFSATDIKCIAPAGQTSLHLYIQADNILAHNSFRAALIWSDLWTDEALRLDRLIHRVGRRYNVEKTPCTQCSRRYNWSRSIRNFLILYNSQTSIYFFSCAFNMPVVAIVVATVRNERRVSLI